MTLRIPAVLLVVGLVSAPLGAQTTVRLPLPVDLTVETTAFELPAPTAGVLTGVLLPSAGPLTSWAPVFSTLQVDGTLKESSTGSWVGSRPDKWQKVVRAGSVIGGFRVLVRTSPAPAQTRQIQIFWKPWTNGAPTGALAASGVYGERAGPKDEVKIIELTLPAGDTPTGLYGQLIKGQVAQVSLLVRQPAPAAQTPSVAPTASAGPDTPAGPLVPGLSAPVAPALKR